MNGLGYKRLRKFVCFTVVVALIVSFFPLVGVSASVKKSQTDISDLSVSNPSKNELIGWDDEHWYMLTPSADDIKRYSHFRIYLNTEVDVHLAIYPNIESATRGDSPYEEIIVAHSEGWIDFPIAWKGPYYVKVENWGYKEGQYEVTYRGVNHPPYHISSLSQLSGQFSSQTDLDKENYIIVRIKENEKTYQQLQSMINQQLRGIMKQQKVEVTPIQQKVHATGFDNVYIVKLDKKTPPQIRENVISSLNRLSGIQYVQANIKYEALSQDIYRKHQWPLENTNTGIQYKKLENVLRSKKLKKVKVAVLDSGINYTLADFTGKTRDGINFVHMNVDPMDDQGHGTHVSGIIAATAGNGHSVAGINPFAEIVPVKILDRDGNGYSIDLFEGILYAVNKGAKVINISLGSNKTDRLVEEALSYAVKRNVLVVAASGNNGNNRLSYPASSKHTLAVGATNPKGQVSSFSNYGKELDLVAPGEDVPSLFHNGNVYYASGTSMAAPHVSAVAGLLYSVRSDMTPDKAKMYLHKNSTDIGKSGYDTKSGWGRLDAYKVFSAANLNLRVNTVKDNHQEVTGKVQKGAAITVKKGKTILGQAKANSSGNFRVSIKRQKAGTKLKIEAKDAKGLEYTYTTLAVKDGTPPAPPKVNTVYNRDKVVKGKTEPYANVTVMRGKSKLGTGKSNSKGNFSVKIKQQKAGTVLKVTAKDKAGNISKPRNVTVKKR